jgi:hypothetical protein
MKNKILFDFYKAHGRSQIMYRAFFDGSCEPVLTNIGENGPLFITKRNRDPFVNLAEVLPHYTWFAVAVKRSKDGNVKPMAEPERVFPGPDDEMPQIMINRDYYDYVTDTAAEFAASLEPKAEMPKVAAAFNEEIDKREQRYTQAHPKQNALIRWLRCLFGN